MRPAAKRTNKARAELKNGTTMTSSTVLTSVIIALAAMSGFFIIIIVVLLLAKFPNVICRLCRDHVTRARKSAKSEGNVHSVETNEPVAYKLGASLAEVNVTDERSTSLKERRHVSNDETTYERRPSSTRILEDYQPFHLSTDDIEKCRSTDGDWDGDRAEPLNSLLTDIDEVLQNRQPTTDRPPSLLTATQVGAECGNDASRLADRSMLPRSPEPETAQQRVDQADGRCCLDDGVTSPKQDDNGCHGLERDTSCHLPSLCPAYTNETGDCSKRSNHGKTDWNVKSSSLSPTVVDSKLETSLAKEGHVSSEEGKLSQTNDLDDDKSFHLSFDDIEGYRNGGYDSDDRVERSLIPNTQASHGREDGTSAAGDGSLLQRTPDRTSNRLEVADERRRLDGDVAGSVNDDGCQRDRSQPCSRLHVSDSADSLAETLTEYVGELDYDSFKSCLGAQNCILNATFSTPRRKKCDEARHLGNSTIELIRSYVNITMTNENIVEKTAEIAPATANNNTTPKNVPMTMPTITVDIENSDWDNISAV